MKKANVFLKGMAALVLVLPLIFAVACKNGVTTEYKYIDGPQDGPQEINVTPTDKPEPKADATFTSIGFKVYWPPVKETKEYEVWRDGGAGPVFVSTVSTQAPLEKGYYTYEDVVKMNADGEPTLRSGSYTYTIVSIPHVGVRDAGKGDVRVTGDIVLKDTPVTAVSASLEVDGDARAFVFDLSAAGYGIPGTITWYLDEFTGSDKANPAHWTVIGAANAIDTAGVAGLAYPKSGSVGVNTYTWEGATVTSWRAWPAMGYVGGKYGRTYRVNWEFTSTVPNAYFKDPSGTAEFEYKNQFFNGQRTLDGMNDFTRVIDWDSTQATDDNIIIDAGSTDEFDPAMEKYIWVDAFATDIVLENGAVSGARGVGGSTYIVQRKIGAGSWETVTVSNFVAMTAAEKLEVENIAPESGDNLRGGYLWRNLTSLGVDMEGHFDYNIVYDRTLPVEHFRKSGEKINYRVRGTDGMSVDWTDIGEYEIAAGDTFILSNMITLEVASAVISPQDGTRYTVTPKWTFGGVADGKDGGTGEYDPDLCPTIYGLLDDEDKITFNYVRGRRGNTAISANYDVTGALSWTAAEIKERKPKEFTITNSALGSIPSTNLDVFARASMNTGGDIPLKNPGTASDGIKKGVTSAPTLVLMAASTALFGTAGAEVTQKDLAGKDHFLLRYPMYDTTASGRVFVDARPNNGAVTNSLILPVPPTDPTTSLLLTFGQGIDGALLGVSLPVITYNAITVSAGGFAIDGTTTLTPANGVATIPPTVYLAPVGTPGSPAAITITVSDPSLTSGQLTIPLVVSMRAPFAAPVMTKTESTSTTAIVLTFPVAPQNTSTLDATVVTLSGVCTDGDAINKTLVATLTGATWASNVWTLVIDDLQVDDGGDGIVSALGDGGELTLTLDIMSSGYSKAEQDAWNAVLKDIPVLLLAGS